MRKIYDKPKTEIIILKSQSPLLIASPLDLKGENPFTMGFPDIDL